MMGLAAQVWLDVGSIGSSSLLGFSSRLDGMLFGK